MTRLLLAVALAAAVGVGAWALFLRSSDAERPLLVGALEDAVKWPQPAIADERIALASQAGFDALGITTLWTPGQTAARSAASSRSCGTSPRRPDAAHSLLVRPRGRGQAAAARHRDHRVASQSASRLRHAPTSRRSGRPGQTPAHARRAQDSCERLRPRRSRTGSVCSSPSSRRGPAMPRSDDQQEEYAAFLAALARALPRSTTSPSGTSRT